MSTNPPSDSPLHTDNEGTEPVSSSEATVPSEEPEKNGEELTPEQLLPPEAQGEANGGPLGCCLGTMIGILLSLVIPLLSRIFAAPLGDLLHGALAPTVRILMVLVAIIAMIICGYFGWKIGKKAYREYEPPVVKARPQRTRSKRK
ncbi:hypothetical protein [Tengunoibacter tsumagoiensis]|uniref:Uncharacterized protein n=1 Tax=Tengunoibacter tsumagoiensis TaxID=2014871 RepID=A0A402A5A0_9CHLR|nr:hypothetical protein [Tengunoibacter tsumagoiensis]GCE14282.1 hypothetical protein KTT_41410 [Tengunoibacter tsumagoiensis]